MHRRKQVYFSFVFFLLVALLGTFFLRSSYGSMVGGLFEKAAGPLQRSLISVFGEQMLFTRDDTALRQLKEENLRLVKQVVDQSTLMKENKALQDQFRTTTVDARKLVPSRVIGMRTVIPGIGKPTILVIDKGISSGLMKGMAVIYKDNAVGKIISVSQHRAVVQGLFDTDTSVTAKTVKTAALGVVKGDGEGMILENVILSEKLENGDVVVTKGEMNEQGQGFPPDLIIGKVFAVHKKPSALFQSAEVKGVLDVARLTTVFVLVSHE